MPRNVIVTCGTSQIEANKLLKCELLLSDNLLKYADERRKEVSRGIKDTFFDKAIGKCKSSIGDRPTEEEIYCEALAAQLAKRWGGICRLVGELNNPFGAEISTLFMMKRRGVFDPQEDSVFLLYSDTRGGAFCAGVLYRLLMHSEIYSMSEERIGYDRIPDLTEQPENPDVSETNTQKKLLGARIEDSGVKNVFVMTGGFKSIIPTLTVCAMICCEEVYYLFEQSKKLRSFKLPTVIEEPKKGIRWYINPMRLLKIEDEEKKKTFVIEVCMEHGVSPGPADSEIA